MKVEKTSRQTILYRRYKLNGRKMIKMAITNKKSFNSPLNGTKCDCFGEQMRRATPSMHCSFSASRSFSFFLPSRITIRRWWEWEVENIIIIIIIAATYFFVSSPSPQSTKLSHLMPPRWLDLMEVAIPKQHSRKKRDKFVKFNIAKFTLMLPAAYLKIFKWALNAIFSLILTLRLTLFLATATASLVKRTTYGPIIYLQLERLLNGKLRRLLWSIRLRRRHTTSIRRRTW